MYNCRTYHADCLLPGDASRVVFALQELVDAAPARRFTIRCKSATARALSKVTSDYSAATFLNPLQKHEKVATSVGDRK